MTHKLYFILSLVVNLYFSWALAAESEIISLEQGRDGYEGTEDTSVYSENENSNGGGVYLFSGRNAQLNDRRTLIRFDLARVPEGALLLDVTLTLYVSMAAADSPVTGPSRVIHNLHRITNDWAAGSVVANTTGFGSSPGGSGKPAEVGDATWKSNRHQISEWDQEGGDFEGVVSATTQVGMTGELAVWSSAEMLNDIRSWLDDSGANYGWLIRGEETLPKRAKRFDSSEAVEEGSKRPVLEVEIEAPPPRRSILLLR